MYNISLFGIVTMNTHVQRIYPNKSEENSSQQIRYIRNISQHNKKHIWQTSL
jgi:hypothetical protein